MLSIVAGIIFFIVFFTGLGLVFPYRLLRDDHKGKDLLAAFWVGLALAAAFLQVWHLFAPVGIASLLVLGAFSLAGWALNYRVLWSWRRAVSVGQWIVLTALTIVPLLLFTNQSIFGHPPVDHGMYHMQSVKWIGNFAIVPGLGNLHHRFAFNNSSFLLAAQINTGMFTGLAYYITHSLLIFTVTLRGFHLLYHLLRKDHHLALSDVYHLLLLPCALFFVVHADFAGYSPDIFIFALQAFLAGELIESFSLTEVRNAHLPRLLARIVLISALSVTVKLSAAVFAAACMLAVLVVFFWRRKTLDVKPLPFIAGMAGISAALVLPWLLRSVILSGYLVYPSPLISFNVLWKIPRDMVTPVAPIIHNWAMYGAGAPPDQTWLESLRSWEGNLLREVKLGGLGTIALMLVMLALRLWNRRQSLEWQGPVAVFAVAALGFVYWFFAAPDFRFLGAVYWLLVISPLLIFYQQVLGLFRRLSPGLLLALMLIAMLAWLRPLPVTEVNLNSLGSPPTEESIAAEYMLPGDPPTQTTRSGLLVYMANDSRQTGCWNEPLPCTRVNDFHPGLRLIDPSDMQKGFTLLP
jgi:hypothetical protein